MKIAIGIICILSGLGVTLLDSDVTLDELYQVRDAKGLCLLQNPNSKCVLNITAEPERD